jgi:4-hydroxybenzoate polyprenyltransferase
LQKVVGTGVLGFMPLEGALLAGMRRTAAGAAVAALWPVARRLARRRAVT